MPVLLALGSVMIVPAVAAPPDPPQTLQQHPGALQEKAGEDITLRKRPGRTKYSNITLKRGYIQADRIARWRKSLRSRSVGGDPRALRGAPPATGKTLNRELQKLDLLLDRWQRAVTEFERLRARRAGALKQGRDTSRLDARLDAQIQEMERQAEAVRNQADRMETQFKGANQKKDQHAQMLSRVMKTLRELRALGAASSSGL